MAKSREQYLEKLRDPRWQKKRLGILERDGWKCVECTAADKTLHVHHTFYKDGFEPWDYADSSLVTLCADCHESETEASRYAWADLRHSICNSGLGMSANIESIAYAFPTHFVGVKGFPDRELTQQEATKVISGLMTLTHIALLGNDALDRALAALDQEWRNA